MESIRHYRIRREAFQAGRVMAGRDPKEWRQDFARNVIRFSAYGDENSPYGWLIWSFANTPKGVSPVSFAEINRRPREPFWRKEPVEKKGRGYSTT